MTTPHANERLLRLLRQATPEQVERIRLFLEGKIPAAALADEETFISKKETARRLKKSLRTLSVWMQKDWVPFHKVGNTVLFKWSEVDAELARQRGPNADGPCSPSQELSNDSTRRDCANPKPQP